MPGRSWSCKVNLGGVHNMDLGISVGAIHKGNIKNLLMKLGKDEHPAKEHPLMK